MGFFDPFWSSWVKPNDPFLFKNKVFNFFLFKLDQSFFFGSSFLSVQFFWSNFVGTLCSPMGTVRVTVEESFDKVEQRCVKTLPPCKIVLSTLYLAYLSNHQLNFSVFSLGFVNIFFFFFTKYLSVKNRLKPFIIGHITHKKNGSCLPFYNMFYFINSYTSSSLTYRQPFNRSLLWFLIFFPLWNQHT